MSSINREIVEKIAKLSRIAVSPENIENVTQKLSFIMNWVEKLKTVNVDNVEPMTSALPMALKMRNDIVTDGGYPDVIVKNAPVKDGHFFCVPKVIE